VVAVAVPRDVGLAVALLGVLRAGAAFLPLDGDLPAARREFMLQDSGACLVLSDADRQGRVEALALPAGEDLAWVLYTSGSSGRPKGVAGTHRGLANRIAWGARAQPFAADDVACAKSRLGFVDSVCELLAPLAAGVPVVIADEPSVADPRRLAELVVRERVTRLVLVPSLLRVLLDGAADTLARSRLRLISASGEPLSATDVRALRRVLPACELWNIYGCTEVAADATAHKVTGLDSERIPIGRPLDNVTVELCDPSGAPVPLGAIGEIVIGGAGVSPGYLGHARSENHRFGADGRYRTGDLGRWRADHTLEHHGRADRQLKIRGARVEPDELEHALKALPEITDAAATSHPTPHGPILAAYYTSNQPTTPEHIRARLAHTLPPHTIPTHLTELPHLPHLPNGKLDRQTLNRMKPEAARAATVHEPPETAEERAVADVFAELTGAAQVGRQDDFFALGGHSLLATRAVSRLSERLGKAIELRLVFEHRTVAGLAAAVAALEASTAGAPRIERVDRDRFRMG
jgi:acyl-coenzyme A synthetase/AMP-(fatty) acid ligase